MSSKIKLGLVGLGHLGKIHLKCLQNTDFDIVGIFDIDHKKTIQIAKEFGVTPYQHYSDLLENIDAVDIVSTTEAHFMLAKEALLKDKHVFVEKPICKDLFEAQELRKIIHSKPHLKLQVGHVERYNPAYVSIQDYIESPKFIECHRLSTFSSRGRDVSVVYDLMIHDLDILLQIIPSEIKEVRADGVAICGDKADISNARVEFEDGCVANITASRLSLKQMRKFRIFQSNAYLSIDFLNKENQVVQLSPDVETGLEIDTKDGKQFLNVLTPPIQTTNAIVEELLDFYRSIYHNSEVSIGIEQAVKVMRLAEKIDKLSN